MPARTGSTVLGRPGRRSGTSSTLRGSARARAAGMVSTKAAPGARYDMSSFHATALLGHAWIDRRARAEDGALWREYVLRRGPGLRPGGGHPRPPPGRPRGPAGPPAGA